MEANIMARVTEGLRIDGSIGLTKTEITESADYSYYIGNEFINAPNLTARLGATYEHEFNADLSGYITADVTYKSDTYYELSNSRVTEGDAYALFNASLGLSYKSLKFAVHGKNLTDEDYAAEISSATLWTPAERRSVLATLTAAF